MSSLLEDREVVLYCDLHGHSRHQNIFIYGCENRSDPQRRLQEHVFPYMLSRNAPDMFSYKTCRFHVQKNKEGTGRVEVWNMGVQNSYTLEVSRLLAKVINNCSSVLLPRFTCFFDHILPRFILPFSLSSQFTGQFVRFLKLIGLF